MKYTVKVDETAAYKANIRLASQENGGEFFLSMDDQEITAIETVSSTGGWNQFTTIEVLDVILEEGEHSLKFHISNDTPFNISSIEFEKTGTTDTLPLDALNGKTGENEKSIEIAISESLLAASLNEALDEFTVLVNGEQRTITSDKSPSFCRSLDCNHAGPIFNQKRCHCSELLRNFHSIRVEQNTQYLYRFTHFQ